MRLKVEYRTPRELEDIIGMAVIGQPEGIKAIATALSAHLLRIRYYQENSGRELKKDNMLVVGPTGCGKTESVMTVIRELDLPIPVAVVSTNLITGSGWKGKESSSILADLARACKPILTEHAWEFGLSAELYEKDRDHYKKKLMQATVELCNHGIIVLDEFDKIRFHPDKDDKEDFFPKMVQHELLKLIEGGTGFGEDDLCSKIDTTGILFICAGAFSDLYQTEQPANKTPAIGFSSDSEESGKPGRNSAKPFKMPTSEDLVKLGYMPELVGRLPLRTEFKKLSRKSLFNILKNSNVSPLVDLQRLFEQAGYVLEFTERAMRSAANLAYKENTGARGLRIVLTEKMYPVLYSLPQKSLRVVVDADVFTKNAEPKVTVLDECDAYTVYDSCRPEEYCFE